MNGAGPTASIAGLREHLLNAPGDHKVRLRLAELLCDEGQRAAARRVLLDGHEAPPPLRRALWARLARLEEMDGAADAAAARWESLLADDIDDREAWSELERLRAGGAVPRAVMARPQETLASAEGVATARYEILQEIGRGSSATVFLVRERLLNLRLALKVLHPHLAAPGRAAARERFFMEARTVSGLRHPGVVAIYDVDDEARAIAMEHLPLGTLRDRLRRRGAEGTPGLPRDETLALARSLLAALAFIHDHGIIHGDVTPRNLLLRAPGSAVLADFGSARLQEATTLDDQPAGTPLYLAPEQFRGAPASPATDLFGCGALLWEALLGRPMRAPGELTTDRLSAPLPPREAQGTDGLAPLIAALTKDTPAERPPDARAALRMLP